MEVVHEASEIAWTAAELDVQSLLFRSLLCRQSCSVTPACRELKHEPSKKRQEREVKVQNVLFKHFGLQVRLDATALPISGFRSSLTVARERFEQRYGRSISSNLLIESLLVSSISNFIDRVVSFVRSKAAAHPAQLKDVVPSVPDSLTLDVQSILRYYTRLREGFSVYK